MSAIWVSGDFFGVSGAQPFLGRLVSDADNQTGCSSGVEIATHSGCEAYPGAACAVGQTLTLEANGEELFALACKRDLEGMVAKRKYDPYIVGQAQWLKIRNRKYSPWVGREKLFEPEREADPDILLCDICSTIVNYLKRP